MLKIIGGEFRSRILAAPKDDSISRPYASRVKESVFNLLRGWFEGATVIDLFAGVGTVGLECASRGAEKVFMVERDVKIFHLLQENIEALGCGDRAVAVCGDALSVVTLDRAPRPADVIFIDPPYEMMQQEPSRRRVLDQAGRCRELMGDQGFLVLRSPVDAALFDAVIPGFDGPEEHSYGQGMHVLLYAPARDRAASGGA